MTAINRFREALFARLPARYTTPTADYAKEKVLKDATSRLFYALDRMGVHLLPKHFYTPVSDYVWLRANRQHWDSPAPLTGIEWNLEAQLEWLAMICRPYVAELGGLAVIRTFEASCFGPGFGPIDAQLLYCAIRSLRPARIIEIGSGMSTAIMAEADRQNCRDGHPPAKITAIDPYPRPELQKLGAIQLISDFVQREPLDLFDSLDAGDLLFIDSSHTVAVGSDVVHLFLRVLPRLRPGVLVHVHDVSLPYLYPRTALEDYFGWQETALLAALLTGNERLQPLACLSALHYDRTEQLQAILPDYVPQENDAGLRAGDWLNRHMPDSFWMLIRG